MENLSSEINLVFGWRVLLEEFVINIQETGAGSVIITGREIINHYHEESECLLVTRSSRS